MLSAIQIFPQRPYGLIPVLIRSNKMRLSGNPESEFYDETKIGNTKVFLNGEYMILADEFDDEEGWVNFAVPDANGQVQLKPGTDEIWTERLYGNVTYETGV